MQSESPFDVVIRMEPKIRSALLRACGSKQLAEEAWGEVVLARITRIVDLYDESRGSLEGYVLKTVRWYAFKFAHTEAARIRQRRTSFLGDVPVRDQSWDEEKRDAALEVSLLLNRLHPYDAWLLRTRLIEDHSFSEMADAMGVQLNTAKLRFWQALRRAQDLVREEVEAGE